MLRLHSGLAAVAMRVAPHDLHRWRNALPRYTSAHVDRVRRFWRTGQGESGLFIGGDHLNHPRLEGAVICALRIARTVAGFGLQSAAQPA